MPNGLFGAQELPQQELQQELPQDIGIEPVDFLADDEEEKQHPLLDYLDQGNIVEELEDNQGEAQEILNLYEEADRSMLKWRKKYKRAVNLAKLQAMSGEIEIEEKTFPFDGASLVMMPYILEAMLDFSSRAAPELVWTKDVVKAKIYGTNSKEKDEKAKRVQEYSNYQLSEMIPNWRNDQDKGLMVIAATGTFYKKTYWDAEIQEVCSDLHLADEIIFNHDYKSFKSAPDVFLKREHTRNDVIGYIRGEQQWSIDEDDLEEDENKFEFIEAYTWIDLDDDGLKEPYIAVIWPEKTKIVALYPYFDEDTLHLNDDDEVVKIDIADIFTQYRFIPDPEGGPMGLGWGILLGPMFDAINTNVRQLIDAGTLSNVASNSGLIAADTTTGRGNSIQSGPIEVKLGQLTPVPVRGGSNLQQNVVQFPFAGPNQTLFQLMEYLIQSSRSMTNASVNVESNPGEAASLFLARLQQGLKVPNSIIMRIYDAAKSEFQKIAALNYKHFDSEKYNRVIDADQEFSMEADFNPKTYDVVLASDPTQGSDIERAARADAILQEAKTQPQQVLNLREAYINWLEVIRTPDVEAMAPEPDPNAVDPQQQLFLAQQQMEAEFRQRDQALRENEQRLKEQKMALEAAKEMSNLGLQADKQESEITKNYTQSLKNIVDAEIASGQQAIDTMQGIEERFIDQAEGGLNAAPTNNASAAGDLAGFPGEQGISPLPGLDGGGNI